MSNETDYPGALDVVGYNYTEFRYEEDHDRYPERVLYDSETRHELNAWKSVADNEYIFGQFIWAGFEYLGEAGPWPSRGFTTGMIDLANNIKPIGWFRRALWSDEPVAYLGTYWRRDLNDWGALMTAGRSWNYREGQTVRVVCYTNGDEAELLLDGKVVGERKPYNSDSAVIHWDIPHEPGELKVVAYKDGDIVASDSIKPDGKPVAVKAAAREGSLKGKYDVAVIPVSIIDGEGKLVYESKKEITCTIKGPGKLLGIENGLGDASKNYRDNIAVSNHGRLVAYVQAMADNGTVELAFAAPDLKPAKVTLNIEE